eukprot:GHVS01007003.1.p1 GENE.GHVS01007003.1~~GHVS01007003.1.p1  ORF type:complete len:542 (+),score=15.32 GHVS01007003.1:162-1787(+)
MTSNSYTWRCILASLPILFRLLYGEASPRLDASSLAHHVDFSLNRALGLTDGRKGFSVAAFLTGWLGNSLGASSFPTYPDNTIALSVGTNNYFDGTLIKQMLEEPGVSSGFNVRYLANLRIMETVDTMRKYLSSAECHRMLHAFSGRPLHRPTMDDVEWYWLNPVDRPFAPSSQPPIPGGKFHQSLLNYINIPLVGNRLGLTQTLSTADASIGTVEKKELDKLQTSFINAMTAIRNDKPKVLEDFPAYSDLPAVMPDLTYHYLYGGWFDLRGILVIKGLSEITTTSRPQRLEHDMTSATDVNNVLSLPAPAPLSTDTFLHKKTVLSILTRARMELIRCLRGVYLVPVVDRFQARPFMYMDWKDITPEYRLMALHYNSHAPAETQSSHQPLDRRISYDWPSALPFPAASLLVQQHPEMLWRLSQFGGARDMVLNDTWTAKKTWSDLWNSLGTLNGITVALLVIAVTQLLVTILLGSLMVKKIKQGKERGPEAQDFTSTSTITDGESSSSLELTGLQSPARKAELDSLRSNPEVTSPSDQSIH